MQHINHLTMKGFRELDNSDYIKKHDTFSNECVNVRCDPNLEQSHYEIRFLTFDFMHTVHDCVQWKLNIRARPSRNTFTSRMENVYRVLSEKVSF